MLQRPGSSWGFGALLKDTSVVVLKEDTPPTNNPCRTWDSNPQPLDYESDSLTIRPRLPSGIHLQESLPSSFDPLTLALSILILFLKKIKKTLFVFFLFGFFLFIIQLTKAKKASNTSLLCSIFFLFRYFTIKKKPCYVFRVKLTKTCHSTCISLLFCWFWLLLLSSFVSRFG